MSLSGVLDTVIGVSFVFFLLSLASSAVAEWLATLFKKRAKYLLRGLRSMLDGPPPPPTVDPPGDRKVLPPGLGRLQAAGQYERTLHTEAIGVLEQASTGPTTPAAAAQGQADSTVQGSPALTRFLGHPLIAAQAQTRANGGATRAPSYLSAHTFATVVVDLFAGADAQDVPAPLTTILTALAKQTDHDVRAFSKAVEQWYDAQMDRVSGAYKRWIKRWIIIIATMFILALHVDAIALSTTLWQDPAIRQATVAIASPSACDAVKPVTGQQHPTEQEYLTCLKGAADALAGAGLPIGLPAGCRLARPLDCLLPVQGPGHGWSDDLVVLAGLGLSVLAASVGAPFWFQVLTRAGSLRNTGTKPAPADQSA